jgi:hypothetical protein
MVDEQTHVLAILVNLFTLVTASFISLGPEAKWKLLILRSTVIKHSAYFRCPMSFPPFSALVTNTCLGPILPFCSRAGGVWSAVRNTCDHDSSMGMPKQNQTG